MSTAAALPAAAVAEAEDEARDDRRWIAAWWVALIGLILVEVVAATLRYDGQGLARSGRWELWLLGHAGLVLRWAIVASVAALVLGGRRMVRVLREDGVGPRPGPAALGFLAGHLGAMAAFLACTERVFGGRAEPWLAGVWLAAGLSALLFWAFALLPPRRWARLVGECAQPLGIAAAVGVVAVGLGGLSATPLWDLLRTATFNTAAAVLGLFYPAVVNDPAAHVLGTSGFQVRIAPQCSGLEGIGLIWAFLGAYLALERKSLRFPHALLLLPAGTLVMWTANVARIVALVALGSGGHPGVALGGFHSQSGWLIFNGVALGLVVLTRRGGLFRREASASSANPAGAVGEVVNPTAPYLAPLLALVGTTMLTGLLTAGGGGGELLYPARVVAVLAVLLYYRRGYAAMNWRVSWAAPVIGLAVFALWMALEPPPASSSSGSGPPPAVAALSGPLFAAWVVFRVVGSVVAVPLAEELAFRGYLTRRLIAADFESVPPGRFSWPSLVISSVLFGALHGRWLAGILAGVAYALAWYRRGSIGDAVFAHALTNGLIALAVLGTRSWHLWA